VSALVSAELLRLRTVRGPRWSALGGLVFIALTAYMNLRDVPDRDLADSMRSLAVVVILLSSVAAATHIGSEFQRGTAVLTYLTHRDRSSVAATRCLVYAALGGLFAGLGAAAIAAVGADAGPAGGGVAQLIAGGAAGGAIMSAAGVLLGTVTRNPTIAAVALVVLNLGETFVSRSGAGPYLPFGLLNELMGASDGPAALAALGLLLAYFAVFFVLVRRFALPRDLT
jgi:ABC-type transport system involved in multi-copper enzyme maturation permease subunit